MDGSLRSGIAGTDQSEVLEPALACNICLRRISTSPVALSVVMSSVGHVYRSRPQQGLAQAGLAFTPCPVCETALREGVNIVPVHGDDGSSGNAGAGGAAAAANSDTAIPPRPNPPPRIARPPFLRPPPARPPSARNVRLRNLASAVHLRRIMGALGPNSEEYSDESPYRMHPYSSARNAGLGVASNLPSSARMRRNRRSHPRMEGSGNIYEFSRADDVLADILAEMHDTLEEINLILSTRARQRI